MADELYVCGLSEDSYFGERECFIVDACENKNGTKWIKLMMRQEGNNFVPLTKLFSVDEIKFLSKKRRGELRQMFNKGINVCTNPLTHSKDLTALTDNSPLFNRKTLKDEFHEYKDIHTGEIFNLKNPSYQFLQ
ncbi:MAG: hypothetical protein PVJ67_05655 [Candidatus Pacearchaeota archaeon]|jgi:hypothetical protein